MHGQKRAEYKARLLQPDTRAKLGSKAQQWNHLSEELLKQRRRLFASPPPLSDTVTTTEGAANVGDAAAAETAPSPEVLLALTEKMLSVNPDPSHLWNIRREMLVYLIQSSQPSAIDTAGDNQEGDDNNSSKPSTLDIEAELKLTAHCLQRNPKSYSAWFHRKWALVYFMNGTSNQEHWANMKSILQSELELCAQFLQLDERNFHCWNFRRFVVGLLGSCGGSDVTTTSENDGEVNNENDAPSTKSAVDNFTGSWLAWMHQIEDEDKAVWMGPQISQNACRAVGMSTSCQERNNRAANSTTAPLSKIELEKIIMNEWDFSTAKIQDNFSNGSAFHYRSKLLPLMLEFRSADDSPSSQSDAYEAISLARDEWDGIVLDAIFTEPDDQTIWFYHRFVVTWARRNIVSVGNGDGSDAEVTEEFEGLLYDMVDSIQELIDVEKEDSFQGNSQDRHESKGAKCKWAYLGMHLVLSTLLELKSNDVDDEDKTELCERAKECLHELIIIDPDRRERYQILESELI
eukprot:scaffold7559_cov137-Skeletonema_menzelii.AAC.7